MTQKRNSAPNSGTSASVSFALETLEPRKLLTAYIYEELPTLGGQGLTPTGIDAFALWGTYGGGSGAFIIEDATVEVPVAEDFQTLFPLYQPGETVLGVASMIDAALVGTAAGDSPILLFNGQRIDLSAVPETGAPAGATFGAERAVGIAAIWQGSNSPFVVIERTRTDAGGALTTWLYDHAQGTLRYILDADPVGITSGMIGSDVVIAANRADGEVIRFERRSTQDIIEEVGQFVATSITRTWTTSPGVPLILGYAHDDPTMVVSTHDEYGAIAGAAEVLPIGHSELFIVGNWRSEDTGNWSGFIRGGAYGQPTVPATDVRALDVRGEPSAFATSTDLRLVGALPDRLFPSLVNVPRIVGRYADSDGGFFLRAVPSLRVFLANESDTGSSAFDQVTRHNNSTTDLSLEFLFTDATAGATITIEATPVGGGDRVVLGSVVAAGGSDAESIITSGLLADGQWTIVARATVNGDVIEETTLENVLTIDTAAPVFTSTAPTTGSVWLEYNAQTQEETDGQVIQYAAFDHGLINFHTNQPGRPFFVNPDGSIRYIVAGSRLNAPIDFSVVATDLAGNAATQLFETTITGVAAYYPEGFTGADINEFLPISNPNDEAVRYMVSMWYEGGDTWGSPGSGEIDAHSRGGLTISRNNVFEDGGEGVRLSGVPYALELISALPLTAMLSHYDFDVATGEMFTTTTSTIWTIADGAVNDNARDFIVWFNAGNENATVTVRFFNIVGEEIFTSVSSTGASRRGGLDVAAMNLPDGAYSAVISSDQPLVAALTKYVTTEDARGYTALASPGEGSRAGAVPFATAAGAVAFVNTGDPATEITVTLAPEDGSDPIIFTFNLGAGARTTLNVRDHVAPGSTQRYAISYTSTAPVHTLTLDDEHGDLAATAVATTAAESLHFADGFVDPSRAGEDIFETLALFNPDAEGIGAAVGATITFNFTDGTSHTEQVIVPVGESVILDLHELAPLLAALQDHFFYSIDITAAAPLVAQLSHFDLTLGAEGIPAGGFGTMGGPIGPIVPLPIG